MYAKFYLGIEESVARLDVQTMDVYVELAGQDAGNLMQHPHAVEADDLQRGREGQQTMRVPYGSKNLVAAGLCDKVQVQLAYAIGVAEPVSVRVETYGTGKIADEEMTALLRKTCDLTPGGIIRKLDLRRPIYRQTAAYGHFGRNDLDLPWEKLDKVDALKAAAEKLA